MRGIGVVALVLGLLVGACGGSGGPSPSAAPVTLRLGYFPNVTHAAAVVGIAKGFFTQALGANVSLDAKTFNAGPDAVTALFGNSLDATFIGPNPAINAFKQSNGEAIRIVAGATSGGAFFVVRDGINSAADLRGTTIGTPQLGNTQDVALRAWLSSQGMTTTAEGGGDVHITPQSNAQNLETFAAGQIDGAWVPEPWATRMIQEGNGHVLVDERDLWPNGQYVTTHLIVRTEFLQQHRDVIKKLIEGLLRATDYVNESPSDAQTTTAIAIAQITSTSTMSATLLEPVWANLMFTVDPIATSLQKSADDQKALGFIDDANLAGIYDLSVLNEVLREAGRPEVVQP
jgi:NitT/TauT family transport system substrate-binding protein